MSQPDVDPKTKTIITNAMNDALKELISSVHGLMPENVVVLNVIVSLCKARKELGFTFEQSRDEVVKAMNQIAEWEVELGGKT